MKPFRVVERVERDRMLRRTRHAEVVAHAADANHERVVRQRAARKHLLPLGTDDGLERDLPARAVERAERALAKPKMVPVRDREVVEIVRVGIHPAGRHLVEQRLPHMRRIAVDERDLDVTPLAVAVAELGRERQATGAPTHDHDSMCGRRRGGHRMLPAVILHGNGAHQSAGGSCIATPMRRMVSTSDFSV